MKKLLHHPCCREAFIILKTLSIQSFLAILLTSVIYAYEPNGLPLTDTRADTGRNGTEGVSENKENAILTITGRVVDEKSGSIPGVNVIEKGTANGTTTDVDGKFSINVQDESSVLVFSFIGYVTQEVVVNGRSVIDLTLREETKELDAVVVIGYGTAKKSDLTGSVASVNVDNFKTQPMVQFTDMLAGTVAGFNANQGTSAAGGASMEVRGPKSLSAGTEPLIVLDGVIFTGSLRDINPNDIQSIDILKDASSAAVFGSKAASGVILITTMKGKTGKPTINFSTKLGVTESNNQRRGLNPEQYIQFRQDYFRQMFPTIDYDFYTHPDQLPGDLTIDEWRALSSSPVADNTLEWMGRLRLFPEEQANYLEGETMDMYDEVFRKGMLQEYDVSISGGTDNVSYYWSVGYNDNEGIRVGDQFSSIRSRLNVDFQIAEWLNVGMNTQFSDRDETSVPSSMSFYVNSPYGEMWDADGNLKRYPHGHSDNPLLDYHRTSLMNKSNNLFANMYASIKLPLGFDFKVSFQPRYGTTKYLRFINISQKLGAIANEIPSGERRESSTMNYMIDNLLTWKREFGDHNFDVTLLANIEENQFWSTTQTNKNFLPNQALGYHGLQFGDTPGITNNDSRSTGDALMARINYTLKDKYMLTASIRRDGYSAFGTENPRAVFPAFAVAWVVSEESFFKVDQINRMKLRFSWGVNGNRDIGMYAALANTGSSLWYDGTNTRVGVYNTTLANPGLRWEKTASLNFGLDVVLLDNRIDLTADVYDMTTTDLLMNRILPRVTGFSNITTNLGELGNRGFELTLNTKNISTPSFNWRSNFVFSLNRNKIKKLFGDVGTYTLLGEERFGEVPDYSNQWFPGQPIDVIWDYDVTGIWQTGDEEAATYGLQPGDFKAVDVNGDGRYVNLEDKRFIGYDAPRYRLGFRNDISFLKNFTASFFIRADLGHMGSYTAALNSGYESNDRWNRNNGPVPYWTADRPSTEYARLNPIVSSFGGGLMIYKPRSFVRIQDVSLSYSLRANIAQRMKLNNVEVFGAVRNLATFTKWPGWDPESGMTPMPRTYTFGLSFSL
ncbi:MAG: TonB-dependent receptor [Cyclobacteriaceae bacterium]